MSQGHGFARIRVEGLNMSGWNEQTLLTAEEGKNAAGIFEDE